MTSPLGPWVTEEEGCALVRPMSAAAKSPMRFLSDLALRYPGRIIRGLILSILGTLLAFVLPNATRWIIDEIIPARDLNQLRQAIAWTLGALLFRQVFFTLRTLSNNEFQLRMTSDLRSLLHAKMQHLPVSWFDRQSTGDTITRMSDDVPATQRAIIDTVDQSIPALMQIVTTLAVMGGLHGGLTAVALAPMPFIALGAWSFSRWVFPKELQAREAAGGLASVLSDNVAGIRQIKAYTLEDAKQKAFESWSERYREMQTRLQRAWSIYAPSMGFISDCGGILIMGCGAWWCIEGQLTVGQLSQFLLLSGMLYEPVARLNGLGNALIGSAAAARRVSDLLDTEGAEDLDAGEPLTQVRGEIRFQEVTFRHGTDRPAVTGLNLAINPGQTVALVGATGAGKSTSFQLLTRFYEPNQGAIVLDGRPLGAIQKRSLRTAIAYVTQESYLFNESIRDNLRGGKPDATEAELWAALDAACAREFVERLPERLDTQVGERGGRLSGGEKQRIAIARAFLKDAPILLLDEATSAVDAKSEQLIKLAIDRLRAGRTCLVIAHRLSTVRDADRIYVLKQGEVIADGTHDDLLKSSPEYSELARLSLNSGA